MTWYKIKDLTNNKWLIIFELYCSDRDLNQYFIDYINLLTMSTVPIVIIFDMRNLMFPNISHLTKHILFIKKMKHLHKIKLEMFYLIINKNIIKNLVDYIFTIIPPVVPYKIIDYNI